MSCYLVWVFLEWSGYLHISPSVYYSVDRAPFPTQQMCEADILPNLQGFVQQNVPLERGICLCIEDPPPVSPLQGDRPRHRDRGQVTVGPHDRAGDR